MRVTAQARRAQGWWAVDVPEIPGAFTQAKRLDQIPAMVADAVSLLAEVPVDDVEVVVLPMLEGEANESVTEAASASREAAMAQERASQAMRKAVHDLLVDMPMRDVATVLHVSHQRVSQLAKG